MVASSSSEITVLATSIKTLPEPWMVKHWHFWGAHLVCQVRDTCQGTLTHLLSLGDGWPGGGDSSQILILLRVLRQSVLGSLFPPPPPKGPLCLLSDKLQPKPHPATNTAEVTTGTS